MTLLNCPWTESPAHPVLAGDEVHVWCVSLDQQAASYMALLSPDEQARVVSIRFPKDQRRFTVGRGLLRTILGLYLYLPPEKLRFVYQPFGKPALMDKTPLQFNLTHSGDLALVAVTLNRKIGVDLEQVRPLPDVGRATEQFFSTYERDELSMLPPEQRLEAFLNGWTRKEAYLKARGDGLTYPLDQFSVSIAPDVSAQLLKTIEDSDELARWSLQSLTPVPGYIGALAVDDRDWQLVQWRMDDSASTEF